MEHKFEELINAWIRLSVTLRNEKITKDMTFSEAIICNFIYSKQNETGLPVQIKELCQKTNMAKPLMNRVLNDLEVKGMITREKTNDDLRNVYIRLKEHAIIDYKKEHENSLRVAKNVANIIGKDLDKIVEILNRVSDSVESVLEE